MRIQYKLIKTLPVAVLAGFIVGCSNLGGMMVHEKQSPYDFDQTVTTIENKALEMGWVVPKIYDFQASLIKQNQPDPGKVKIIKLCHPKYASTLLNSDNSRFVSAMMPCSVGIYEKSDGKVYVASMNMGLMSKMFGGAVGDTLAQVAADDAEILEFLDE